MHSRLTRYLVPAALALFLGLAVAPLLGDRPAGDRSYALEQRLRCPVCQSVSIAESPSQTAAAMRQAVRQQVAAGRSDRQIIAYFRARYGDWVVLSPPARGSTLALWLLPVAGAAAGLGGLYTLLRHRSADPAATAALPEEQRRKVADAVRQHRADGPVEALW